MIRYNERVINLFYNGERTFSSVLMDQELFIKREKCKYTNSRRKRVVKVQRFGVKKKEDLFAGLGAV